MRYCVDYLAKKTHLTLPALDLSPVSQGEVLRYRHSPRINVVPFPSEFWFNLGIVVILKKKNSKIQNLYVKRELSRNEFPKFFFDFGGKFWFNNISFLLVERLKQQMEEKEVNLEDLGSKLKNLEREKLKLVRDLEQWNGEQSKLDTFERENRDLMQVCAILYIFTVSF